MTKEFKSLKASVLSHALDAEADGSEPIEGGGWKPIIEVGVEDDQITIACTFPGFHYWVFEQDVNGEKKKFTALDISGAGFVSRSGHPLMPVFRRFVNVPLGCNIEIDVEKSKAITIGDILVSPAQENVIDGEQDHEFEFDEDAYKKNTFNPKDIVKIGSPQDIDGYNAVLLEICPLRFNGAKRRMKCHGYIKATLKFSAKEEVVDKSDYSFRDPGLETDAPGNLLLNPGGKSSTLHRFLPKERPPLKVPLPPRKPYRKTLLIIYHKLFKAAARKLADWKRTKGIPTELVDIDTVGNTKEKIKEFIRGRKKRPASKLQYVLLFGDIDRIVTEIVPPPPPPTLWGKLRMLWQEENNATDYYYSTPEDPPKPEDTENELNCILPNIAIGRIPVRTLEEALAVVDQVIAYEKTPPCDPAYYDRMTVAAYFHDTKCFLGIPLKDKKANMEYIKTMEGIRSHLVSIGKEVRRVYVSDSSDPRKYIDGEELPDDVKKAIVKDDDAREMLKVLTEKGQLLIGYRGHSSEKGWQGPSFGIEDLSKVKGTCPSIFFSINCLSGRFDLDKPEDCFAEKLLKMKGGAPSLIAPTRVSGTWRNDSFIKALYDGLFPGIIPSYPAEKTVSLQIKNNRLGDIHNYAKEYLFLTDGKSDGVKDHLEIYHVIGDPTLELWTAMPKTIDLTVKMINGALNIQLSDTPKDGILTIKEILKESSEESSEEKDGLIKRVKKPSRQQTVAFPSSGKKRRSICVCFIAPGYRYVEKTVKI